MAMEKDIPQTDPENKELNDPVSTQQKVPPEDVNKLNQFHSQLLDIQQNTDIEGITEDFDQFSQDFEDPEYRQQFHSFLIRQQEEGRVTNVPEDYDVFNEALNPTTEFKSRMNRSMLPEQFQQMDIGNERVTDQAFDSTEALDQYGSLEDYKQAQIERAERRFQQEENMPRFNMSRGGLVYKPKNETDEAYNARKEEFNKGLRTAELQYDELVSDFKSGNITQAEFKEAEEVIWDNPNAPEELIKGLTRGVVSVLPSMMMEFASNFYFLPFDIPLNGASENTKKVRKNFEKAADWFTELGKADLIKINENLKGKSLDDIIENPALAPAWLAAKVGESAPSMLPGFAAMKVFRPVSTIAQYFTITAGVAPLEIGAQQRELRDVVGERGYEATLGEKSLAVGSGFLAALFEGFADRYLFTWVEDSLKNSGLSKVVKEKIRVEIGQSVAAWALKTTKNAGKQSLIEGGTEPVQQILANIGVKYGWDPGRGVFDGVGEATVIGVASGGSTTIVLSSGAAIAGKGREVERAMDPGFYNTPGSVANVSFNFPASGDIMDQYNTLESEKQRIIVEREQAEKAGNPTINHDMAITRIGFMQSKVAKQIQAGEKEATMLLVAKEEEGPAKIESEDATRRRAQAIGEGTVETDNQVVGQVPDQVQPVDGAPGQAQPVDGQQATPQKLDIAGQPVLSPEEFNAMNEDERKAYSERINSANPRVSKGAVPFVDDISSLGFTVSNADAGLQAEQPGSRTESGEVANRGREGRMQFETSQAPEQKAPIEIAARQAGLTVTESPSPAKPGVSVALPLTKDGASGQEIRDEATSIATKRNPELRESDAGAFIQLRDTILEEEVIPSHGGERQWTDSEVLDRWEAFTQNLETESGFSPDRRVPGAINTEQPLQNQLVDLEKSIARAERNQGIAEARGGDVATIAGRLTELQTQRNEVRGNLRTQITEERRKEIGQEGTIEEAIGQQVTLGEYKGTLTTDNEGRAIIETEDGTMVEIPDVQQNLTTELKDTDVVITPSGQGREMNLTDAANGIFEFRQFDPLEDIEQRNETMTFQSSNLNDAGEVVSVTMQKENGDTRTFRDPEIIESVTWQLYFGQESDVTSQKTQDFTEKVNKSEREVDNGTVELQPVDQKIYDVMGDPTGEIDPIMDKIESNGQITPQEQNKARDWAYNVLDQIDEIRTNPENNEWLAEKAYQLDDVELYIKSFLQDVEDITRSPEVRQVNEELARQEEAGIIPMETAVDISERLDQAVDENDTRSYDAIIDQNNKRMEQLNEKQNEDPEPSEPSDGDGQENPVESPEEIPTPPTETGDEGATVANPILDNPSQHTSKEYVSEAVKGLAIEQLRDAEVVAHMINKVFIPAHKEGVATALTNREAVPEKVLQEYPDLQEGTLTDPEEVKNPTSIERTRTEIKDMTREKFKAELQSRSALDEAQINSVLGLIDKRAKVWAKQNKRSENEYWKRRFRGFDENFSSDPDLVNDIVESYPGAENMRDVESQVEEHLDTDQTSFEFHAESVDGNNVHYDSAVSKGMISETETEIKNPIDTEIDPKTGEFVLQQRQVTTNKNWDMTRPMDITDSRDIAYMFSELEDATVEHVFIVGETRDGEVVNFHLGKGAATATVVDIIPVPDLVQRFDVVKVHLVHNHPSGTIQPSKADIILRERIENSLPAGVTMEDGIIIDRDSGFFSTFNALEDMEVSVPTTEERQQEQVSNPDAYTTQLVQNYDRLKLISNNRGRIVASGSLSSPADMAEFADAQRHGITSKTSLFLTNSKNQLIGIIHLRNQIPTGGFSSLQQQEDIKNAMANEIRTYQGRYGAFSSFLVTNQNSNNFSNNGAFYGDLTAALQSSGTRLVDIISVAPTVESGDLFQSLRSDGEFGVFKEKVQDDYSYNNGNPQAYRTGEEGILELFGDQNKDFESIMRGLTNIFLNDMNQDQVEAMNELVAKDSLESWEQADYETYQSAFLKYLQTPEKSTVSAKVKEVFNKLKEWIAEIYHTMAWYDDAVDITPEVRTAFDELFNDPQESARNSEEVLTDGLEVTVNFRADGTETITGTYALIESREVNASHNPDGTINSGHVISKGQPRDRRSRKYLAQHKNMAQKLNQYEILGFSLSAFSGIPVTNQTGEGIQGHGRLIALLIAYAENPDSALRYKEHLYQNASDYGFTQDQVLDMDQPIAVRKLTVSDEEAIRLGNLKNVNEAEMDPIENAIAGVRTMDQDTKKKLSNLFITTEADNLRAILDEIGPEIIDLIPSLERSNYLDDNNNITVKGKDYLQDVLRALVFDDASGSNVVSNFSELPGYTITGIEKSYGSIIKYLDTPADLSPMLQKAVTIVWNVKRTDGYNSARDFTNQGDIFDTASETFTENEIDLAQALLDTENKSSALMKSLNTESQQKAITLLFRKYEQLIDGKADLFNPNDTAQNTTEGAESAFQGAFTRNPQSERPVSNSQEPISSSISDVQSSRGTANSTEIAHTKATGLTKLARIPAIGPADTYFLEEKMSNRKGKKLLKKFEDDVEGTKVGMRSVINFFNDAIGVQMRVGKVNTTRKNPANMSRLSRVNRARSGLDVGVFHEAGHAIHFAIQDTDSTFLEQFNWSELMDVLEANNVSRASAENTNEYFTEWVRAYIINPALAKSLDLTNPLLNYLEKNDINAFNALNDTARLYKTHLSRGTKAVLRGASKDQTTAPNSLTEGDFNGLDKFRFEAMGRNRAIDVYERDAVWKAFREVYDNQKEANKRAREFLADIRGTSMDLRLAHQVMTRIPGEVNEALTGRGFKLFSIDDGVLATTEQLNRLRKVMDISDKLYKDLSSDTGKSGRKIALTEYAIKDVLDKIGSKNYLDFELYAQYKVSIERLIANGTAYTGITEVDPKIVAQMVADMDAVNPEWEGYFKEINDYMDKLVLGAFLGGNIGIDEAVRIINSYDNYIPLPRIKEDGTTSSSQSSTGGALSPDTGLRGIKAKAKKGEINHDSDLPIVPLLKAIEERTYKAIHSYYENRAMLAPIKLADYMANRDDIPLAAKVPANRMVSRLKLDIKKMATLNERETQEVIAKYLTNQMILENEEGATIEPVNAKDILVYQAGQEAWRDIPPNAVQVIAPKVNGETVYYQIGSRMLYEYYADTKDTNEITAFFDGVAEGTKPWKETLTTSLNFTGRNMPKDIFNSLVLSLPPDYTIDTMTVSDFVRTTTPAYLFLYGVFGMALGKTEGIVDTELQSRNMQNAVSLERKFLNNSFTEELKRGVVPESGWKQLSGYGKTRHVFYTAPMWILHKPSHLWRKYYGQKWLAQKVEMATRLGAYQEMKRRGFSDEIAAMAYDHPSGNFGERPGNSTVHAAYKAHGFMNPGMQVYSEIERRIIHKDRRIRWLQPARLGMVGVWTGVMWALTWLTMSDDKKEELEERTVQERRNYMPFFGMYRVPYEYGLTGAYQSFVWLSLDNKVQDNDVSREEIAWEVLSRAFDVPLSADSPAGALSNVVQMLGGPVGSSVVEAIANFKFYWEQPIVPPFLTQYSDAKQTYITVPGFYNMLGELADISPLKIQHVVNNATGNTLGTLLGMTEKIRTGEPLELTDISLGGKLVVKEPRGWLSYSPQTVSDLNVQYKSLLRELKDLKALPSLTDKQYRQIEALELEAGKLGAYHNTAKNLDKMYQRVKRLREDGQWEEAKFMERQMTEMAASTLAQMNYNPNEH